MFLNIHSMLPDPDKEKPGFWINANPDLKHSNESKATVLKELTVRLT
jgi:hypothetical protein